MPVQSEVEPFSRRLQPTLLLLPLWAVVSSHCVQLFWLLLCRLAVHCGALTCVDDVWVCQQLLTHES